MGTRRGVATGVVATVTTAALALVGAQASAEDRWVPPDDTVVRVSGTAADGFRVERYDGAVLHLPTTSEAVAECGEYDRRLTRTRCRVELRTWYRDLGDLKRALRLARHD